MMSNDPYDLPPERILRGPRGTKLLIPYRPVRRDSDLERDFPRFHSPIVVVAGYQGPYGLILQEGTIELGNDRAYKFSDTQMEWLKSKEALVESMLQEYRK